MNNKIPEPDDVLEAPGEACSSLPLLIKTKLLSMTNGQVLMVRNDDPFSREGIPAWSRLSGNELLASVDEDERSTCFYLRKK